MSLFDQVLTKTVAIVEASALVSNLESVTIIRDLGGRVRLVLEFKRDADGKDLLPANWDDARDVLAQQLQRELGPYWRGQIWRAGRPDAVHKALGEAIDANRQLWDNAPTTLGGALQWYKVERTFSKSSWMGQTMRPPWMLDDPANPAIVSFSEYRQS